jgi:hypothetical protein
VKRLQLTLAALALAACAAAQAQDGKAALVKQFLDLQRPAIESMARTLVQQSSGPIAESGTQYLRTQVPADKREAAAKAADAEITKYFDATYPLVRDKALQDAPVALGPLLEKNFSEDELRQLVAWISSPVAKKYQELNPQLQAALAEKVVADTRATVEPRLRTLNDSVAKALGAPANPPAPAGQTPAKPAPAKK